MFPTQADFHFAQAKLPMPKWMLRMVNVTPATTCSIDVVVNAHAGVRSSNGEIATGNLLSIVRSWRRRGVDVTTELARIASSPQWTISSAKRVSLARKWMKKMGGAS
jgi:hypothetical protein